MIGAGLRSWSMRETTKVQSSRLEVEDGVNEDTESGAVSAVLSEDGGITVEEFPRVETEIVSRGGESSGDVEVEARGRREGGRSQLQAGEVITTLDLSVVGDRRPTDSSSDRRRGAARRFSLFHWFRGKGVGEISESNRHSSSSSSSLLVPSGGNKAANERATNQLHVTGKNVETASPNQGSTVDVAAANTVGRNSTTTLPQCNSLYSSSGSVDTNCSTATVHSFTFLHPGDLPSGLIDGVKSPSIQRRRFNRFRDFRKHSSAEDFGGSDRICAGSPSDGETAVDCHGEKEERKLLDEDRENGSAHSSTPYHYRSLPTSGKTADLAARKTNKVHVRGKRRAPDPPSYGSVAGETRNSNAVNQKSGNTGRRNKRRAPNPPSEATKTCDQSKRSDIQGVGERPQVISNDTLKLEGGLLLPTRFDLSEKKSIDMNHQASLDKKTSPLATTPLQQVQAPRPWYKRSNTTLSDRDCGSFRREVLKIPTLSKNRGGLEKTGRFSLHQEAQSSNSDSGDVGTFDKSFSRLNHFFGRTTERREQIESSRGQKRGDEKRRSNLSILTNISELDREAAAIVQEEQARNQAVVARSSGLFTDGSLADFDRPPSGDIISDMVSSSIEPQRKGTRALISKFNAISNITKVTVNATFFTKSSNQSGKIDVVRGEPVQSSNVNSRNSDRIVTKRLLYDGAEQVNETGVDISSINFFRRLEAADAAQTRDDIHLGSRRSAPGWEEKIKRYFPERTSADFQGHKVQTRKSTALGNNQRQSVRNDQVKRSEEKIVTEKYLPPNNVAEQHLSRADLKEMLIEMKHSLPKRPKPKSGVKSVPVSIGNDKVNVGKAQQRSTAIETSVKQGEGQGVRGMKPLMQDQQSRAISSSSNYVRSTTAVGKRDQQASSGPGIILEKTKVSSGVQTSANLRNVGNYTTRELSPMINRVRSSQKFESRKNEDANRVSSNLRKSPGRGTGLTRTTFQLIRPRDFASIEALKTEKTEAVKESGQNTYMNVIEDSLYANTVISPSKSNSNEAAGDGKTGSVGAAEEKINIVKDNKHENVRHYTASVVAQVKIPEESTQPEVTSTTVKNEEDGEIPISETNMNTLAINRLLRKLEGAIASGQHQQAAGLAKELAQLKIHCSVVRQRSEKTKESDVINVDMYIEDKLAHQGPIPLQLSLSTTVSELKKKVFGEFEIPVNVQRWIIGKNLADNDEFTLEALKAVDKSSIFLYLVAPDLQNDDCTRGDKIVAKEEITAPIEAPVEEQPREIEPIIEEEVEITPQEPTVEELKLKRYEHLMSLENTDVIPNSVPIECPICFAPYGPCEGVILRDCLHMFCRTCIANTIMYCEEAEVKCPFRDSEYTCESTLQEREIKALVTSEVYEQHLAKSVSQAENNAGNNAFHCKTPDCPGWCIYDDNVNVFQCPVCGVNNCLTCQAIHTNKNCREYQDEIRLLKETDQETKRTAAVLEEMVESGEALACPTCAVVLMKKWGCDWLRCSMCKTEICWVTRGPRWGPGGKGDTSGGCKCGENGVKCHPRCNYCH
ncbi:uncharacterized protein LOC107222188 [Neodiprion lecontei]|uniref:Uncharacterized protein LOC107222188 n=1 Tax=Neodiprion lecontei TaxID=441921 RepID=A0A6J0BQV6_NEOLC|nr:uncharacterized protein LOC107222188 [Neodiprion lecontei]